MDDVNVWWFPWLALFILTLLVCGTASAQTYDKDVNRLEQGIRSYNNKNYEGARRELEPLATRGWAEAQYYVGMTSYQKGQGKFLGLKAGEDYKDALYWLSEAANRNYPDAYTAIAQMYDKGHGVKKNPAEARDWRQRANAARQTWNTPLAKNRRQAERGDTEAYADIGRMYYYGRDGVAKNIPESVKWFRQAAERGNSAAQYNLGLIYSEGKDGVPQNYSEAVKWYRLAANQGTAEAMLNLGALYHNGQGVSRNYDESIKLNRQAIASNKLSPENFKLAQKNRDSSIQAQNSERAAQQQRQRQRDNMRLAVIVIEPSNPDLGKVWIDSVYTNDSNASYSINGRRLDIAARSGNLSSTNYSIKVAWGGFLAWMSVPDGQNVKYCTYSVHATPGKIVTVPVGMSDCRIAGRGIHTSPL